MRVKICGLSEEVGLRAALDAKVAYVGFVFAPSPRAVTLSQAVKLARLVPANVCKVGLCVDADDIFLDKLLGTVPLDMLQLHGSESADRVISIREHFKISVIKAVGIFTENDLEQLQDYSMVCDQILLDAKPTPTARRKGGHGRAFNWQLIAEYKWLCPWLLAGGLTVANVAAAIQITAAKQVDVSSGVEKALGQKYAPLIKQFVQRAEQAGEKNV